jgi:hypothetical protein
MAGLPVSITICWNDLESLQGSSDLYVLDISWEDAEGKARFQRIPVGH